MKTALLPICFLFIGIQVTLSCDARLFESEHVRVFKSVYFGGYVVTAATTEGFRIFGKYVFLWVTSFLKMP
jgi:hypothetical protein